MARDGGPFNLYNPWPRIAWSMTVGLLIVGAFLGFLILGREQQNGPALGPWLAICRALGISSDNGPAGAPQPPLRIPTHVAWTSEQRVVWRYDLMDAAYDAQPIIDDCLAAGRVPVIDRNTRRDTALKAEIAADRARRHLIHIPGPTDLIYNDRTTAERANARLKDEFGARHLRVRGHLKASCHLMFGVAALAADSIFRLFSARFHIQPA